MTTKSILAPLAAALLVAAVSVQAAPFANGDLILSFQATSGEGVSETVAVNLGPGHSYRDATADELNVINVGGLLSSTYGPDWYDREDLYICLIGMRQIGGGPASNNYGPVVDGDTRQTVYAGRSKADADPLNFSQYTGLGFGGGTQIIDLNTVVGVVNVVVPGTGVLFSADSGTVAKSVPNTIEDFTTPDGILLANFIRFGNADFNQAFTPGVLFSRGGADYEGALTLQRLIRSDAITGSNAGQVIVPGAPAGTGSNEGYFAIRSSGQIDYIAPVGGATPTLTVNPTTLSGFSTTVGTASAAQTFTVSGTNLTADATITAPVSFEVSTNGVSYTNVVSLTQSGGTIPITTNYVRIATSASVGSPAGNVTVGSTGATTANVSVSGTVNSLFNGWAIGYGLNPALTNGPTAGAPTGNPDNDPFDNNAEFAFGTDPTVGSPALVAATRSSTNVIFTYLERNSGFVTPYNLRGRTNLTAGSWTNTGLTPTAATNTNGVPAGYTRKQFSVTGGAGRGFYQIQANP